MYVWSTELHKGLVARNNSVPPYFAPLCVKYYISITKQSQSRHHTIHVLHGVTKKKNANVMNARLHSQTPGAFLEKCTA